MLTVHDLECSNGASYLVECSDTQSANQSTKDDRYTGKLARCLLIGIGIRYLLRFHNIGLERRKSTMNIFAS